MHAAAGSWRKPTRACQVTTELITEYFIWKTPEARELLDTVPKLNDKRIDSIVNSIRQGARIPTDCGMEHVSYLAHILVQARQLRDFDAVRDCIDQYRNLCREYSLLNRLNAAWLDGNFQEVKAALDRFREHADRREDGARKGLAWANVADAAAAPEPLFQYGLPPGGFGLIIGSDGVGKGWLTLDLLLGCVLARPMNVPVFRRDGPPLRALYLCYEDDPRILRWRLDRICECAGVSPEAWRFAEREGALRFAAEPAPLFVQGARGVPLPTDAFHDLAASLKKTPADLCIIDPLAAAVLVQSENDNSALNAIAVTLRALARDTGCAILLTHHTSKAGRDLEDHNAARGGSALTGAARWVLRLFRSGASGSELTAAIPKNSYGVGLRNITLHRLDNGVLQQGAGDASGKESEALIEAVVRFVDENPEIEINPKAVRNKGSEGARRLIEALGASPKAVGDAVENALDQERLQLEERHRPDNRKKYQALVSWRDDDADIIPF